MSSTACIALHSSQSSGRQWRMLEKQFLARPAFKQLNLSMPDLVGYGSGTSLAELNLSDTDFYLADEYNQLQAQQGGLVAPYILIGHSFGGALALHWARCFPEQVKALILYEPVAFHVLSKDEAAFKEINEVAAGLAERTLAEGCAHFVDYWNHAGYFETLPANIQALMVQQQVKVQADFHALLHEPATLEDYQKLACPVHLYIGRESPMSSRQVAKKLAAVLPRCELKEVQAGHMGPITHANQVTPLLLDSLEQFITS